VAAHLRRKRAERFAVVGGKDELGAVVGQTVYAPACAAAENQLVGRAGAVAALEHPLEEDVLVRAARRVGDRRAASCRGDGFEQRRPFWAIT